MRIRECLVALLIASTSFSAVQGQAPAPSLEDAERSLIDALTRHDRAAFVMLFAPDAESSWPVVKHGPEAIASSWLPFLIDPGTTMVLGTTGVLTATSGDIGNTTGAFAIRGRTNKGIQTIPVGTYSIVWRLIDGNWRISTLGGSSKGNGNATGHKADSTIDHGGVGLFRFGMTRTEVSHVSDCQPYTNVSQTGGLECAHYLFEGHEVNISFLFTADRLHRIQLWLYDGESNTEAREAVKGVLGYLQRTAGGTSIGGLPGMKVTPDGVMDMLNSAPPQPGRIARVEISTPASLLSEVWFSRIARHQFGYAVLLFADPREGR